MVVNIEYKYYYINTINIFKYFKLVCIIVVISYTILYMMYPGTHIEFLVIDKKLYSFLRVCWCDHDNDRWFLMMDVSNHGNPCSHMCVWVCTCDYHVTSCYRVTAGGFHVVDPSKFELFRWFFPPEICSGREYENSPKFYRDLLNAIRTHKGRTNGKTFMYEQYKINSLNGGSAVFIFWENSFFI